jgi:hypothetical protein
MTTTSNKPTYRIFAVSKRGEGKKSHWLEVGAAWSHRDGRGLSLKLDFMPLNGAELVLRVPEADETATADEANDTAV